MGVNKVILLGRLGKDPELRYTPQQVPVCNFTLATGERRKDQSGNWAEHTEWHNIVCFGKTAENCASYLKKGREAFIEGRIQTRKWQNKEGQDRYSTEVIAGTVQFVGGGGGREAGGGKYAAGPSAGGDSTPSPEGPPPADEVSFNEDDIPF